MTLWEQIRDLEAENKAMLGRIQQQTMKINNARAILENEPDPAEAATLAAKELEMK